MDMRLHLSVSRNVHELVPDNLSIFPSSDSLAMRANFGSSRASRELGASQVGTDPRFSPTAHDTPSLKSARFARRPFMSSSMARMASASCLAGNGDGSALLPSTSVDHACELRTFRAAIKAMTVAPIDVGQVVGSLRASRASCAAFLTLRLKSGHQGSQGILLDSSFRATVIIFAAAFPPSLYRRSGIEEAAEDLIEAGTRGLEEALIQDFQSILAAQGRISVAIQHSRMFTGRTQCEVT